MLVQGVCIDVSMVPVALPVQGVAWVFSVCAVCAHGSYACCLAVFSQIVMGVLSMCSVWFTKFDFTKYDFTEFAGTEFCL